MNAEQVARGLGWFSLALGAAEVAAPGKLNRFLGVGEHGRQDTLVRAYGARELLAGAGLLLHPAPALWVWSRVAGDVLDLASLGQVRPHEPARRRRVAVTLVLFTGITVVDVLCARALTQQGQTQGKARQRRGRHG